jgi:hypothetical protein
VRQSGLVSRAVAVGHLRWRWLRRVTVVCNELMSKKDGDYEEGGKRLPLKPTSCKLPVAVRRRSCHTLDNLQPSRLLGLEAISDRALMMMMMMKNR